MRSFTLRRAPGLFLIVAASLVSAGDADAPAKQIRWIDDIGRALEEAEHSGRPILVDVWASWCFPCKLMESMTYTHPDVLATSTDFVPLKVDADREEEFTYRHRVEVLPCVLFLDSEGNEITRLMGLVSPSQLVEAMGQVRSGYPAYRSARKQDGDPNALQSVAKYLTEAGNPRGAIAPLQQALEVLGDSASPHRDRVELQLAETRLAVGKVLTARKSFRRLAAEASDREVKGRALVGLLQAERYGGSDEEAKRVLDRLRREFPELVE